jgi:hypothetical protein
MLKNILKIFYNYSILINIYRFLKGGSFFLPRDGLNFKHLKKKISVHDKLLQLII